jgi:hypothetical protein
LRQRLLRLFVRRGLLPGDAGQAMAEWEHGGGLLGVDHRTDQRQGDNARRQRPPAHRGHGQTNRHQP